jgi:hypothetical protein
MQIRSFQLKKPLNNFSIIKKPLNFLNNFLLIFNKRNFTSKNLFERVFQRYFPRAKFFGVESFEI